MISRIYREELIRLAGTRSWLGVATAAISSARTRPRCSSLPTSRGSTTYRATP